QVRPAGTSTASGITTRNTGVRFFNAEGRVAESALLEDVHINPDVRSNSLIVSAPPETMRLIELLVIDLDVQPAARAEINIFTLKKADATTLGTSLQQLFLGQATGPGGPKLQATTGTGQIGLTNSPPQIIPVRITVDTRTNSLIVAGT